MAKVEVANSTTPNAVCVFGLVKQKNMGKKQQEKIAIN